MQPPAVGIKVGHDFKGHDHRVESFGLLQVVVPKIINNIVEEFGNATFGCFVAGVPVVALMPENKSLSWSILVARTCSSIQMCSTHACQSHCTYHFWLKYLFHEDRGNCSF
jgi:hypothetical protein